MKLIVGLGNPGKEYERTRHNVGFIVLDQLQASLPEFSSWEENTKFQAFVAGGMVGNEKVILVKPTTYMNLSGEAVSKIGHYYKVPPPDLIVVHDEKDIPLGDVRVEKNRNHAGHNGVRSIIETINTKEFTRVRVGIKSESQRKMKDTAKFVLGKFGLFEKKQAEETVRLAVEKVMGLIR